MGDQQRGDLDWAAQPIQVDVIEVPLTTGGASGGLSATGEAEGPNWRRAIGIAVAVGSALGIIGGLVLANDDDDEPDAAPGTTLPADQLGVLITTPPTLQRLDTIPQTESTATTEGTTVVAAGVDTPEPLNPSSELRTRAPLPTYPGIQPGYPGIQPGSGEEFRFELQGAVERFSAGQPARSVTSIDHPELDFEMQATTTFNPDTDRFRLDIEFVEVITTLIVDLPTGLGYLVQADGSVEVVSPNVLLDGIAVDTVEQLFEALLYGPVRPDTFNPLATEGRGLYNSPEFGVVRQFETSVADERLPVWFPYLLGPGRPGVSVNGNSITYVAYVDRAGDLRRVDGVSEVEGSAERITHVVTVLNEAPVIDLPDVSQTSSTPTTPATTQPSSS